MQEHLGGFPDGHNACHLRQGTADFYMQAQFTLTLWTPWECMNYDTQTRHSKISPVGKLLQVVLCEKLFGMHFASVGDSLGMHFTSVGAILGCILLVRETVLGCILLVWETILGCI